MASGRRTGARPSMRESAFPRSIDEHFGMGTEHDWHPWPESEPSNYDDIIEQMRQFRRDIERLSDMVLDLKGLLSETKEHVFLADLNDDSLRLRMPLFLLVEEWPEEVIARSPELHIIVQGETPDDAILAFKEAVANLFWEFKEAAPSNPGKSIKATQAAIQALVAEKE